MDLVLTEDILQQLAKGTLGRVLTATEVKVLLGDPDSVVGQPYTLMKQVIQKYFYNV